jgi:hypothetical protein
MQRAWRFARGLRNAVHPPQSPQLPFPAALDKPEPPPVSLRPELPVQQHRCLDGHPLQTVSANDGSACSMPNHDAGKTRFAPIRSIGKNLPPGRFRPDHDDEPPHQSLRSWNQSITAVTHLTDVVGLTDTLYWLRGGATHAQLEKVVWRIPAGRMKVRAPRYLPLFLLSIGINGKLSLFSEVPSTGESGRTEQRRH